MPIYVYQSLDGQKRYEFMQNVSAPAFSAHPETGEQIERIIVTSLAVNTGLKRSLKVNKKSAAATACGCAKKHAHCHH